MINTIIQGRMLVFVQQVNVLLYYVRKITACRRENTVPSVWRDGYQEGDWCHTGCVFRDRCICWYIFVLFADD